MNSRSSMTRSSKSPISWPSRMHDVSTFHQAAERDIPGDTGGSVGAPTEDSRSQSQERSKKSMETLEKNPGNSGDTFFQTMVQRFTMFLDLLDDAIDKLELGIYVCPNVWVKFLESLSKAKKYGI